MAEIRDNVDPTLPGASSASARVDPAAGVVSARPVVVATRPLRSPHHPHGIRGLFSFLGWVFTGFGLAAALRSKGRRYENQEITVYSVHRAFFLWPLLLTGAIGAFLVGHIGPKHPRIDVVMGWFYVVVLAYTLVSLLFDISTPKFFLWLGIFVFFYILFRYIEAKRPNLQIIGSIAHYLRDLEPHLDHGFAVIMSWLLLIPWIGSLFATFTNGRKHFTPNEIAEWHLGEGTELTDRSGLQFRTKYRDIFETLLGFGAGDLLAIDGTQTVRKRWENILFLSFVWPRIDEILMQRAAVVDNTPQEPVEVQEVRPR